MDILSVLFEKLPRFSCVQNSRQRVTPLKMLELNVLIYFNAFNDNIISIYN